MGALTATSGARSCVGPTKTSEDLGENASACRKLPPTTSSRCLAKESSCRCVRASAQGSEFSTFASSLLPTPSLLLLSENPSFDGRRVQARTRLWSLKVVHSILSRLWKPSERVLVLAVRSEPLVRRTPLSLLRHLPHDRRLHPCLLSLENGRETESRLGQRERVGRRDEREDSRSSAFRPQRQSWSWTWARWRPGTD